MPDPERTPKFLIRIAANNLPWELDSNVHKILSEIEDAPERYRSVFLGTNGGAFRLGYDKIPRLYEVVRFKTGKEYKEDAERNIKGSTRNGKYDDLVAVVEIIGDLKVNGALVTSDPRYIDYETEIYHIMNVKEEAVKSGKTENVMIQQRS